jgi:hypothetical protein
MVDLNIKTGHIICTINERIEAQVFMGVQLEDRTTIDMFVAPKSGRPKSNPYTRDVQVRVNKREQRLRDKGKGMRRMEVKMPQALIDKLDAYARLHGCTRTRAVEKGISQWLAMLEKNFD